MVHSWILVVKNAPFVEVKMSGSNEDEFNHMMGRVLKLIEVAEEYGGTVAPIEPEKLNENFSVECTITFKNYESRGKYLAAVPFI